MYITYRNEIKSKRPKTCSSKAKLDSNSSIDNSNSFKNNFQEYMLHYVYRSSAQDCSLQERNISNGCHSYDCQFENTRNISCNPYKLTNSYISSKTSFCLIYLVFIDIYLNITTDILPKPSVVDYNPIFILYRPRSN